MTKTIQQIENNSQVEYFKSLPNNEQKNGEENEIFELILVDIKASSYYVRCVKKNMYDPELKYICISYRWGELNEQKLETPDYTAHITSFHLKDLNLLCEHIKCDPDLNDIPYLWIDAISVDQYNHSRKKDTILKMNQIYQHAIYILAVPDLHKEYLRKNTANMEIIDLIELQYYETIYNEMINDKQLDTNSINDDDINNSNSINSNQQQQYSYNDYYLIIQKLKNKNILNENEIKKIEELALINKEKEKEIIELKTEIIENKDKKKKEDKNRIYQFLAYLIEDWSNRAWVISEYHIAKDKYKKYRTPLKYIFLSLLTIEQPFFSYHFNDDDDDDQQSTITNELLYYKDVINPILFNQFLKSMFMQRSHLDMILNSNATRNEDRFNAILPSWNEYNHVIKNKNTISDWNITDMTSVRLKLFDIMDDLWDRATLLYACSMGTIFPTFASEYLKDYSTVIEKLNYSSATYKKFEESLLKSINGKNEIKIKQLMNEYKMNSKSIWNDNLTSIQFEPYLCSLSIKSNSYFIKKADSYKREYYRNKSSLDDDDDDDDEIYQVTIPFFTSNLPGYIDHIPIYKEVSKISLVGNINQNKWILISGESSHYKSKHFCSEDYTFTIY